jgi:ABC-2 type transport system ATP-binding protein
MPAISVSHLSKSFGPIRAVDELSFTAEHGAVTGFLGPNGAGKSTTLRMLLGLVRPTAGTATINGRAYRDLPNPVTTVGAVLESTAFHPGRRALDHLQSLCVAAGLPRSRAEEVLDTVALTAAARRRVGAFSLGMRQRLAIASALLGRPDVLVLDEPSNGLDPDGIHWMRTFLRAYADDGHAVLVSSHVLPEVERLADQVVIIAGGRLVRRGALAEFTAGAGLESVFLGLTTTGSDR